MPTCVFSAGARSDRDRTHAKGNTDRAQRDAQLKANRDPEGIRKAIAIDFDLPDPHCRAVDRVMLASSSDANAPFGSSDHPPHGCRR